MHMSFVSICWVSIQAAMNSRLISTISARNHDENALTLLYDDQSTIQFPIFIGKRAEVCFIRRKNFLLRSTCFQCRVVVAEVCKCHVKNSTALIYLNCPISRNIPPIKVWIPSISIGHFLPRYFDNVINRDIIPQHVSRAQGFQLMLWCSVEAR